MSIFSSEARKTKTSKLLLSHTKLTTPVLVQLSVKQWIMLCKLLLWILPNASVRMDIPGEIQTPVPCLVMMANNLLPLGWIVLPSRMQMAQTVLVAVPAKMAILGPMMKKPACINIL